MEITGCMERVRQIVRADEVHREGYIGTGVTVAALDTGIASHIDFDHRMIVFLDCISGRKKAYDDNGHGTHIAGIIGGSGFAGRGKYRGIAPGCNLLMIKVLDQRGNGNAKLFVKALDWVLANRIRYRIRILNISVGMLPSAREKEQYELLQKVEEVWNAGIIVVAAAGNNGPGESSITVPGLSKAVITVGSSDDGTAAYGEELHRGYSGRGPTPACVVKPEVVAPGTSIVSCDTKRDRYTIKSGTSMATPVVSGALALLLQKEPGLSPAQAKLRLYQSSVQTGGDRQGWGRLDLVNLLHKGKK